MEWSLKEDLRDCLVAAAPYGGPIGKGWDPRDPTLGQEPPSTRDRGCPAPPTVTAEGSQLGQTVPSLPQLC